MEYNDGGYINHHYNYCFNINKRFKLFKTDEIILVIL